MSRLCRSRRYTLRKARHVIFSGKLQESNAFRSTFYVKERSVFKSNSHILLPKIIYESFKIIILVRREAASTNYKLLWPSERMSEILPKILIASTVLQTELREIK